MNILKRGILHLSRKGVFDKLSDEKYIKLIYWCKIGKRLNLKNPKSFNEKIQWIKLNDRKPIYTQFADKYAVRDYVKNTVGEQYLVPLLGVWDNPDDIDFDSLPDKFVLKCNHNSGLGMYICRDKSKLDREAVISELKSGLAQDYYLPCREWCYKNIKRKVIAEQFLEDKNHIVPEDYKVYCINGKPVYIVVFHNRFNDDEELSETVYDTDWKKQNISLDAHFAISDIVEDKPEKLDLMLELAQKLSQNTYQSRIDFYIVNNELKFGEITLYTASGFQPMIPESLDLKLGNMLKLPLE